MRNFFKEIVYWLWAMLPSRGPVILMYHSISDNKEFFSVPPEEFRKQMNYLFTEGFSVIPLSALDPSIPTKNKTVVITFDDGYADNFTTALPILRQYNFPATFFISTKLLGTTKVGRKGSLLPFLTTEQCLEMKKTSLVEFGSHCEHHFKLTLLGVNERLQELSASFGDLKQIFGQVSEMFAYPYGNFNGKVENEARKYYKRIVTVKKGVVRPDTLLHRLPRNAVDSEVSVTQFKGLVKRGRL